MDEIRNILENLWKLKIKEISIKNALLLKNSNKGSKNRQYSELKMAAYLCPNEEEMDINTAKILEKIQTHMIINVKSNFKEQFKPNLVCNACKLNECNQRHPLECQALVGSNELVSYILNYEDVFNDEYTREKKLYCNSNV